MQSKLNPYLCFRNNARDAMEFYRLVFGGSLDIHTFKEYDASQDASEDKKIMHAVLETANGMTLMAADTPESMEFTDESSISISLSGDNAVELSGFYKKLSAGGTITMPLKKSPWGDSFGMCTDKFGINWVVNISGDK